jgi:hypothetical protein
VRALARRVGQIERQTVSDQWGIVPIVEPDGWPDEVRVAYEGANAAGDWGAVEAIVEARTGAHTAWDRRNAGIVLIEVRHLARTWDGWTR